MGRNFSNTSGDAGDAAAADAAAQSGAVTALVVVGSAVAEQAAAEPDAGYGQGGLYEMRDGQRVLIERTAQEGSAA